MPAKTHRADAICILENPDWESFVTNIPAVPQKIPAIITHIMFFKNTVFRCSEGGFDFNELKSLCMIAIETMLNLKIASTKYITPLPIAL